MTESFGPWPSLEMERALFGGPDTLDVVRPILVATLLALASCGESGGEARPAPSDATATQPDVGIDTANVPPGDTANAPAGDAATGPVLVRIFGGRGTDAGQFIEPSSVELDSTGRVYVAGHEDRVQQFTSEGDLIKMWGVSGAGDAQ